MSETTLLEELNERELEIIPLLAEGLSNKEIANRLFLAPNTVKWYVRQLNSKLYTSSREEIVERAQILGLMQIEKADKRSSRPKQNLPHQTTPFIGRDAELDEIRALIENDDIRLLTILAQGGMGKTRIALEAAEQQVPNFEDGVYFVALQPLSDVANIVPQIASAIGFQFGNDGTPQKQQLLDFLAEKSLLLLTDNWEHLLEGVPLLNEIFGIAPNVKIIATSREKLNLLGESVYLLQGMHFPDWETPEDALEYDAVQLLVQSAQRVKTSWQVTQENLPYVARICRLTQGMPLGILLATSWLDVYSLERIAEEIRNSADILESDMRDIPERQQSIRAVFEYSWKKLKPQEQDCLMKMSVFRGGCTPKAAETITGANGRTLQGLINKSLLVRNQHERYDIHELLRQYAEMYLNHSDLPDDVRNKHMTYYAAALHECEEHLQDARQWDAVNVISDDFENVRVAWLRASERKRFDLIDMMQLTAQIYILFRTRHEEIFELFEASIQELEHSEKDVPSLVRARIQQGYARLLLRLGKSTRAEQILRSILPILRESGDIKTLAHCMMNLGRSLVRQDRHEEALTRFLEAYDLSRQVNWIWLQAGAAHDIGYVYSILGDLEQNKRYTLESYDLHSSIENKLGVILIMNNLASLAYHEKDRERMIDINYQGLEMAREYGIASEITIMTANIALYELRIKNNVEGAELYIQESLRESRNVFYDKDTCAQTHRILALIALMKDDSSTAIEQAQTACAFSHDSGNPFRLTLSRYPLALAQVFSGKYDDALSTILKLIQAITVTNDDYYLLPILAMLVAYRGNPQYAAELLGISLKWSDEYDWVHKIPGLLAFREQLSQELGEESYKARLEHGQSLDVIEVIKSLADEFGGNKCEY